MRSPRLPGTIGSSPRMRGTRQAATANNFQTGIIPADAGNTDWVCRSPGSCRDHPRGCGEHCWSYDCALLMRGSSPRMRGTLILGVYRNDEQGIIPADAGNTLYTSVICASCWDHPRGCGEHSMSSFMEAMLSGSSPRMRGTLEVRQKRPDVDGIIPADAGNTS